MKAVKNSLRAEMRFARKIWPELEESRLRHLRCLLVKYKLSVLVGEITRIDNNWYVSHSGLLQLASRRKCSGIVTVLQEQLCDPATNRWVFRAIVYKAPKSKGFSGFGDADCSNIPSSLHGAELRIAETRAVNRALRKAYGIGLCSVEELGAVSAPPNPSAKCSSSNGAGSHSSNGAAKDQPRLRDQLCLLIRQFKLDPNLVKSYAADYCGTEVLSEASRELVEGFIAHLGAAAKKDRSGLICKLNSYAPHVEAGS